MTYLTYMFNLPFLSKKNKIKPYVLVILDGFGIAPPSEGNPVTIAKIPNYSNLLNNFPNTQLIASGESVGLPANEVGNTEVGHLTLGAGRVILQDLKRIDVAIEKGTFFDNEALLKLSSHVKKNNSKMHILGVVGSGRVHSSLNHLYALLQFCKKEGVDNAFLHLFTDGRDSPPKQGVEIIEQIETHLNTIKIGRIASITGRYYAMDRDRRWERTEKVYKALCLGKGLQALSPLEALRAAYSRGQTDEFVEPTLIWNKEGPVALVNDGDGIIFFNFRVDRPKQLTMAFVVSDFENLKKFDFGFDPETNRNIGEMEVGQTFVREKVPQNIFFVTMTEYQKGLPVGGIAFGPEMVADPLSIVLSNANLLQLHMAESEKERFVKYYFNGIREEAVSGEEDLIVPSPHIPTYDKKPEMSLPKLVSEFKKQIRRDLYNFIVINFANPDMVAHSGDINATVKAIQCVDKYLYELVECVLKAGGTVFVTADHGNAEELLTYPTSSFFYTSDKGTLNTDHSNNPVPFIVISNNLRNKKDLLTNGALSDVAPTILALMGITKSPSMTGNNLLKMT